MDTAIPALSLRQPWAWAIFHAGKTIENRTWATKYRGRIRIHAAKAWDAYGYECLQQRGDCDTFLPGEEDPIWFPRGAYVGEVTVLDCKALEMNPMGWEGHGASWIEGPICWLLRSPVAYPQPIPGRGYPGLYRPENFPPYCERRNG